MSAGVHLLGLALHVLPILHDQSQDRHLMDFEKAPLKYLPQYGGFCAYAMGKSGEKVSVNPETYLISNGKLYLFYDTLFVNTLKKWNKEGPEALQQKADDNWEAFQQ